MRNIIDQCEQWLREQVSNAGASGIVLGLSGGIDSSVLAALGREALGREGVTGVIMPCHSIDEDEEDARLLISALDLNFLRVDLTDTFDSLSKASGLKLNTLTQSNMKARLRMVTLYAVAQTKNLLVCGTSNRSEYETGYFTKYGDSGVDLMPLANFLKREIREAAKILGVPEKIITKAPSAGLFEGQTDENDMGFTYDILDEYLSTGHINNEETRKKIEAMRIKSQHKRKPIPIFKANV
ncbi:MAG: NAD(+) synthase [Synergistaceae bacterium]|nr:NAD(+) synthase [Synergistaceae bacterium]